MRRPPGVGSGPNAMAQTMRHALVGDPFLTSPEQWGVVAAIHGGFSTTLSAAAIAGDTSVQLAAAPTLNALLLIGSSTTGLRVTAVTGTAAPYTATLAQEVTADAASGATVIDVPTVDVYLDGTQTLNDSAYLTPGVRHLGWYTPKVGDCVLILRGSGGLASDRIALGTLA